MSSQPPKELIDKWYKKLEKSGFKDQEDRNNRLKFNSSDFHKDIIHTIKRWNKGSELEEKLLYKIGYDTMRDKTEYYRLAGQFLYSEHIKTDLENKVWSLHSDGLMVTEIGKKLKGHKITLQEIRKIISRLKQIMLKENNND